MTLRSCFWCVLSLAACLAWACASPVVRAAPPVADVAVSVEETLRSGRVVSIEPLSTWLERERGVAWDGSNPLMMVELDGGQRAVFRHEDDPWGSRAEVAGYRLARLLGMELVPETVLRTLRADALAPGVDWPFETPTRPGTLQRFLEARPSNQLDAPVALSDGDRADLEVLSFVMGRYDNHAGNLLVDEEGRPWAVDFENGLERQQVRLCEHPFVRRGGRAHPDGVAMLAGTEPFSFDTPHRLVDPTLDEIEATFGPWWGQFWAEGMRDTHARLQRQPAENRFIEYVLWDDQLWVRVPTPSRHAACVDTDALSPDTLDALRRLDRDTLEREVFDGLMPPFDARHLDDLLIRAGQIVSASG